MPKYEFFETYNEGTANTTAGENIVYIPVKAVNGAVNPKLFTSYTKLKSYNNEYAVAGDLGTDKYYESTHISYNLARALLERGMYVLIEGVEETSTTDYTPIFTQNTFYTKNGNEYPSVETKPQNWGTANTFYTRTETETPGEYTYNVVTFETVTVTTLDLDFNKLSDRRLYEFRFITFGGFDNITKESIESALACANKRKDCYVLIDHPSNVDDLEMSEKYTTELQTTEYVAKVRTFYEQFINEEDAAYTSWAGGTSPWINVTINNIQIDSASNKKVTVSEGVDMPGSFGQLFAFANAIKTSPNYFAMAGTFRGIIPGINKVAHEYTSAEVEVLQGRSSTVEVNLDNEDDNNGIGINPIALVNPFGYIVWGNRTLYVSSNKEENRPNYRAFANIRQLVISIAKQCYISANRYTYEPNTDVLWVNFKSSITPLLDKMRSGLGIRGYKIERIPIDKKARIVCKITIKPIEAVEDFQIEFRTYRTARKWWYHARHV